MARSLSLIGCPLSAEKVLDLVAASQHPMAAVQEVMATLSRPPTQGAIERFLPVFMEASVNEAGPRTTPTVRLPTPTGPLHLEAAVRRGGTT